MKMSMAREGMVGEVVWLIGDTHGIVDSEQHCVVMGGMGAGGIK
jgi:hypothetical protein